MRPSGVRERKEQVLEVMVVTVAIKNGVVRSNTRASSRDVSSVRSVWEADITPWTIRVGADSIAFSDRPDPEPGHDSIPRPYWWLAVTGTVENIVAFTGLSYKSLLASVINDLLTSRQHP